MCVIIHKPALGEITREMIDGSTWANRDGFGLMFAADGRVQVERSLDMSKVDAMVKAHAGREMFLHFRYATHGTKDVSNCHPYKVCKGVYLMHNGISPIPRYDRKRSDTWHIARILEPMFLRDRGFIRSQYLSDVLTFIGGTGSKFTLLQGDGESRIIGRELGLEHIAKQGDGETAREHKFWFSNEAPLPMDDWDRWLRDYDKKENERMALKGAGWRKGSWASKHNTGTASASSASASTPVTASTPGLCKGTGTGTASAPSSREARETIWIDDEPMGGLGGELGEMCEQGDGEREHTEHYDSNAPPRSLHRLAERDYEEVLDSVCQYPEEIAELIWTLR